MSISSFCIVLSPCSSQYTGFYKWIENFVGKFKQLRCQHFLYQAQGLMFVHDMIHLTVACMNYFVFTVHLLSDKTVHYVSILCLLFKGCFWKTGIPYMACLKMHSVYLKWVQLLDVYEISVLCMSNLWNFCGVGLVKHLIRPSLKVVCLLLRSWLIEIPASLIFTALQLKKRFQFCCDHLYCVIKIAYLPLCVASDITMSCLTGYQQLFKKGLRF